MLLHVLGFGLGYLVSKLLRYPESTARTVSIEVGMQNGGMAAVLAEKRECERRTMLFTGTDPTLLS